MATKKTQRKGWMDKRYDKRTRSQRRPKAEIHIDLLKQHLKNIKLENIMMEKMVPGSRNSPPFATD